MALVVSGERIVVPIVTTTVKDVGGCAGTPVRTDIFSLDVHNLEDDVNVAVQILVESSLLKT